MNNQSTKNAHSNAHLVLCVSAWFQIRCTHADHIVGRHIRELSQNFSHSDHLTDPFLVAFILQTLLQRYRFGGHLMLIVCQRLHLMIITAEQFMQMKMGKLCAN